MNVWVCACKVLWAGSPRVGLHCGLYGEMRELKNHPNSGGQDHRTSTGMRQASSRPARTTPDPPPFSAWLLISILTALDTSHPSKF